MPAHPHPHPSPTRAYHFDAQEEIHPGGGCRRIVVEDSQKRCHRALVVLFRLPCVAVEVGAFSQRGTRQAEEPRAMTTATRLRILNNLAASDRRSARIGASGLGHPCERKVWYDFRWRCTPEFTPHARLNMGAGHYFEAYGIDLLRATGETVHDKRPDGQQYEFVGADGHLVAKADGLMPKSLAEDIDTPLILEVKQTNLKGFESVEKRGPKAKETHYAQMQILLGLARETGRAFSHALYMVFGREKRWPDGAPPEDMQLYTAAVPFDQKTFDKLVAKAELVRDAEEAPPRIMDKPVRFPCAWQGPNAGKCEHYDACFGDRKAIADVTCRSCVHSAPAPGGTWVCKFHDRMLDKREQERACAEHLFLPDMLPFARAEDTDGKTYVRYSFSRDGERLEFVNAAASSFCEHETQYTSKEIKALGFDLMCTGNVDMVKRTLYATVTHVHADRGVDAADDDSA